MPFNPYKTKQPVSTHSRPKAAGQYIAGSHADQNRVSTHSRPKAAAKTTLLIVCLLLFQHTAARRRLLSLINCSFVCDVFQHTAARRRLAELANTVTTNKVFQHTAARRRLVSVAKLCPLHARVSTHSRPKAAVQLFDVLEQSFPCFNTQPPEGGCVDI